MNEPWFPRPRSPKDLRPLGASGELGIDDLFALLCSPTAVEWRDKVGVSSPADGSAKASTRLLLCGGWVFKTDTGQAASDRGGPQDRLAPLLGVAARVELWHPDKRWLLLWADDRWWPVSVCPQLVTLRSFVGWQRFAPAWAEVIARAIELSTRHGIGLDLGPANFAVEPGYDHHASPPAWYLDDELYPALEMADVAAAIVNRLPEQPELDDEDWRRFGRDLRSRLEPTIAGPWQWSELFLQVGDVPLAPNLGPRRSALLAGLRSYGVQAEVRVGATRDPSASPDVADAPEPPEAPEAAPPRLTAVIADVHGNLAALEAVIAAAEEAGADSWLFLGDAVGYGPQSSEVIARLAGLDDFLGVRGNHDHMLCFGGEHEANSLARASLAYARRHLDDDGRAWLMALPVERRGPLAACGEPRHRLATDDSERGWLAVHGAPMDPRRFTAYVYTLSYRANLEHLAGDPARLCFHGHTHVPMAYRLAEADAAPEQIELRDGGELDLGGATALLINPGSVGQPRDGDVRASFALWDRQGMRLQLRRVRYRLSQTTAALLAAGLPEDLITRLEIGR